jgi:hypothetical protein
MSVINTQPLIGSSGQATGYNLERSLRFRRDSSAHLTRTPSSATNRQTWTVSFWVKRGLINNGSTFQTMFQAFNSGNSSGLVMSFLNGDNLQIYSYDNTVNQFTLNTTQVFRDSSAWYHFVFALDTTNATASERARLYINGNRVTSFSTANYPAQNYSSWVNNNNLHGFGRNLTNNGDAFDGYITEFNLIDGQALTQSSFGETDTITGVWKPKRYTGTYGTNGFYLKFNTLTSTSTLGNDSSGNGNTWTVNNVSLTAGATYDSMTDVPTLTSATAANFPTLLPINSTATITDGNLKSSAGASFIDALASMACNAGSGKWYFEGTLLTLTSNTAWIGITRSTNNGLDHNSVDSYRTILQANGTVYREGTGLGNTATGTTFTTNDVIGVALDTVSGSISFYKNNTLVNTTTDALYSTNSWFFYTGQNGSSWAVNFGQRPFAYTPPSGFVALNTFNLPDSTIVAGNEYMDATLYTGTGSALTVNNASGFRPDMVWVKGRSAASNNAVLDSVRPSGYAIYPNETFTEGDNSTLFTGITSTGFGVAGTNVTYNQNATTYVAWQWQAGQGSTSSNTSGTITSTTSVNASAGFSVVTYTGTGVSNATVGHGLGVAPKMVILKSRSTNSTSNNWWVNHASLSSGNNLYLNTGDAQFAVSGTTSGGLGTLSSTTFTLANGSSTNNNTNQSGGTFVAYCWSEIEGFSKFGSYTGNGSTDGPFIYTGFRPKFILTKRRDATSDWWIQDTARSPRNASNALLFPNLANAEYTTAGVEFDILSNGFKPRNTGHNISGGTYIYMAFAEVPFKNSLGR